MSRDNYGYQGNQQNSRNNRAPRVDNGENSRQQQQLHQLMMPYSPARQHYAPNQYGRSPSPALPTPTTPVPQQYLNNPLTPSPTALQSPNSPLSTQRDAYYRDGRSDTHQMHAADPVYEARSPQDRYARSNRQVRTDATYDQSYYDDEPIVPADAYPAHDVSRRPVSSYYGISDRSVDTKGKRRDMIDYEDSDADDVVLYGDQAESSDANNGARAVPYDYRNLGVAEEGGYGAYAPSQETLVLGANRGQQYSSNGYGGDSSDSSGRVTPTRNNYTYDYPHVPPTRERSKEAYPAWSTADYQEVPVSKEEIEDIFLDLKNKFGFQHDSMRSMYDHLMCMLDSRASRMAPAQTLITLHADYIGGENANYRKWYFAAQFDIDDALAKPSNKGTPGMPDMSSVRPGDLAAAEEVWRQRMTSMSQHDRVRQLALYLLLWGEASVVRFMPECQCFIFKLADDYYRSAECKAKVVPVREGEYLRKIITPLYQFIRAEGYEVVGGKFVRREKDHADIIGYDDINQCFWRPDLLRRLKLDGGRGGCLMDLPFSQRYLSLAQVHWQGAFKKTYKEKRTWYHLAVNFNRVWIIHIVAWWYYTAYNAPFLFMDPELGEQPVQWSVVALGGAVATLFMIFSTVCEYFFVPLSGGNAKMLTRRLIFLIGVLLINSVPTYYVVMKDRTSSTALLIGLGQFFASLVTTLVFAIVPSARLFTWFSGNSRDELADRTFTAAFPKLNTKDRIVSIALWLTVFSCKLVESYFFLSLSFKDPLKTMNEMRVRNCGDQLAGDLLCKYMPPMAIVIMFFLDLVLFFLDTYLWFIIWSTIFSVIRAFQLGVSVWTPWKHIFSMLPKRIYGKLLATSGMDIKYKPKILISQIWNAIVIAMYREHLLSMDYVQRLLYHQVTDKQTNKRTLKAPSFFTSGSGNGEYYPPQSEAERRISFFGQSLSTPIPDTLPVPKMPTFTVLTPHYSEKILLSLKEIIREEDKTTRVTLLEYLKQLHPIEWDNFVRDTKGLAGGQEHSYPPGAKTAAAKEAQDKNDDLAFYSIGFKSSAPEYTLRTRIWASLRAQTLYRTIAGFMNYSKAIKLLYRVESPSLVAKYSSNPEKLDRELANMARRKFKFVVTMQRYSKFNKEEQENAEFLLRAYPDLQIAYLDEQPAQREGEEPKIFSVLIDGHCEVLPDGKRKPKYRIQLPGNPILGDGKSDNQNHAIIFYRGEFLQLVDANQDNYLEECLKIRNVLGEFEQFNPPASSPYAPPIDPVKATPVAILGAREYIFSENIGVLGDIAAGKEQTFGTLTARILALIGGKLHYGHPDFLNAIFMTTRGGVSKAQKGLHLNEDIYAGMNANMRGGRIKHSEYYQCGKGRDLGFGSILHFTTKTGQGMGEQMLSREHYYMGTQLPLDRFLTFYYAHPGFHINNIFIILSVGLFMAGLMFIGAMASVLDLCTGDDDTDNNNGRICYDLVPIFEWIKRCITSIFIVFFIALLPLFLQELTDKGFFRSIVRIGKHFISLLPFFEVFNTQIYCYTITQNLSFGGARYVATGRGFATARIPFSILFSRFAVPSIYFGMRLLLMLVFVTLTIWLPHLIYFWASVVALCISPFLFNPHQFSFSEFIIDYREYLRWMSRGNSKTHANSWVAYCRVTRTMITGYKRKRLGHPSEKTVGDVPRPTFVAIFMSEIVSPFVVALLALISYTFVKSFDLENRFIANQGPSAIIRIGALSVGPILLNAGVLLGLFFLSVCCGRFSNIASIIAAIAHGWALINLLATFELLWYIEAWRLSNALLGMITVAAIQRFIFKVLIVVFMSREFKHDDANLAWWTGRWTGRHFGNTAFVQALREYVCKIVEMSLFAADFILGHILLFMLFPFTLVPGIDTLHSTMLFWLRPDKQIRAPILSLRERAERRSIVWRYTVLFLIMLGIFAALIVGPILYAKQLKFKLEVPI